MESVRQYDLILAEMRRFSPSLRPLGTPFYIPPHLVYEAGELVYKEGEGLIFPTSVQDMRLPSLLDIYEVGRDEKRWVADPSKYEQEKPPFRQMYPLYREKYYSPAYAAMIQEYARRAQFKLKDVSPDLFCMIPSRRETATSEAVFQADHNARLSGYRPFIVVYHNDLDLPEEATLDDLSHIRNLPNVLVVDRLVDGSMTIGETRRLTADIAMETALAVGQEDPIGVALDADVSFLSPGSIGTMGSILRRYQLVDMCAMEAQYDPESVSQNLTIKALLEVRNAFHRVESEAHIVSGGAVVPTVCSAMRFGSHCLVGGYPPVSVAEDRLLARQIWRKNTRAIYPIDPNYVALHDARRHMADILADSQIDYSNWVEQANSIRPEAHASPLQEDVVLRYAWRLWSTFIENVKMLHTFNIDEDRENGFLLQAQANMNAVLSGYGLDLLD